MSIYPGNIFLFFFAFERLSISLSLSLPPSSAGLWVASGETISLLDSKGNWSKKKKVTIDKEREGERVEVMAMLLHNRKVWVGTNAGMFSFDVCE